MISGRTAEFSALTPRTPSARKRAVPAPRPIHGRDDVGRDGARPSGRSRDPGRARDDGGRIERQHARALAMLTPLRRTIARSALPAEINEPVRLPAIVNTETSTPTTAVIPTTTTIEAPSRCGMLLRLISETAAICRSTWPFLAHRPASASTTFKRCARHVGNHELTTANASASTMPPTSVLFSMRYRRDAHRLEHRREQHRGDAQARQRQPLRTAAPTRRTRARHGQVAVTVSLEHRELRHPLANRLHHRVARDEQAARTARRR